MLLMTSWRWRQVTMNRHIDPVQPPLSPACLIKIWKNQRIECWHVGSVSFIPYSSVYLNFSSFSNNRPYYNIKFPVALTKIRGKSVSESSQSLFTFLRQIYGFLAESAQIICISADYILTNRSRICAILNHRQNKSHWGSRVSDTTLSIEWGCGVDFSSCGLAGFVSCFIHIPWQ